MAWKNEVQADNTGKWYTNACRFATKDEAERYGLELASRWLAVREWRATEVNEPVNYKFTERGAEALDDEDVPVAPRDGDDHAAA